MASSTTPKPTLLLIQGSFQLQEVYAKLVKTLEASGFSVIHPALPSISGHDDPAFSSRTLADDARVIRRELEQLVEEQNKTVFVLMHSYGGLVGGEAIPEELSREARRRAGSAGGVIHLFYFAAVILSPGQSVLGVFGESPNTHVKPDGRFRIKNAADALYGDLPRDEALHWESKIVDQSYAVQQTPITQAAYMYIPSTYVVCELDQTVLPQYQQSFAETAGSRVLRIRADHSPMLGQTEGLVDLISSTVEQVVGST
ncbi:hypothetical protein HIM_08172 [Hirsutella minnesotensis 3608]|uniref:AB hydrolase-1 domain-containing protein n=1 Tax=Hirsutella minnesotensis 3608 TaxID=1043627 RepID=A0A0F7ZT51_9HYPO|nr:hypothetical protein HIM_08172 [Hirsutella minnesotensis 3608]